MPLPPEIHFAGWALKRASGELSRDGRTWRLQPQTLLILVALLESPGEVVSREALTSRLWPDGVVDFDTALNSAVRRLRKALGDDPETPRYIETIPRIGYRFIAAVGTPSGHTPTMPPPSPRAERHSAVAVAFATVALAVCFALAGDVFEKPPPGGALTTAQQASVTERQKRARFFLERHSPGDLERSRGYFEQTLDLDPSNAAAYAGLSSVYWLETVEGVIPRSVGLNKVNELARQALRLNPVEAEAHHRLALYNWKLGDGAAAEEHYRRAMELAPEDSLTLAGRASDALAEGNLAEGVRLSERAVAAAPLNLTFRYNLACAHYLSGDFDAALRVMNELLELDPAYRADVLAFVWILRGRYADALALAQKWDDGPDRSQVLALAHFGLKAGGEADVALQRLISQVRDSDPLRVVEVYAYRRDIRHAREWMRAANAAHFVAARTRTPGPTFDTIRLSPFVAPLRATLD